MPGLVMVLNDGETYTAVSGCKIVQIPDEIEENESDEFVKDAIRVDTPSVVARFA